METQQKASMEIPAENENELNRWVKDFADNLNNVTKDKTEQEFESQMTMICGARSFLRGLREVLNYHRSNKLSEIVVKEPKDPKTLTWEDVLINKHTRHVEEQYNRGLKLGLKVLHGDLKIYLGDK